ncbi:MAG: glycine betaine ABC transporter substrate-binding protein [Thermomicrobiales bacterium]
MISRRSLALSLAVLPAASLLVRGAGVSALEAAPVKIGSKNFTEQLILGEMYAKLLEKAGIPVETRLNLGGTAVAHEALKKGEIDLYPEYTGTGLTVILATPIESVQATPVASGETIDERVYTLVQEGYAKDGLVWLDQSPFNNTQALAVKRSFAEEKDIATISDLAKISGETIIVAPSDFVERPDGLKGLQDAYGLNFKQALSVEPGIRYQAIEQDKAQVVLAFGTDGQVSGMDLVLLKDDKSLWPPYHVAPVVRQATLDAYPTLAETLNALAPLLTDQAMSGLNWKVDGPDKMEPDEVAEAFLKDNGLL